MHHEETFSTFCKKDAIAQLHYSEAVQDAAKAWNLVHKKPGEAPSVQRAYNQTRGGEYVAMYGQRRRASIHSISLPEPMSKLKHGMNEEVDSESGVLNEQSEWWSHA